MNPQEQIDAATPPAENPEFELLAKLATAEAESRERLIPLWRYAGLEDDSTLAYPVPTQAVIDLLHKCGYQIDHDLILGWLNQKLIPAPAMVAGKRVWYARQILALATHLETWRRWQPFHPLQWPKLNQFERLQAEAEKAGYKTCFHDLDRFGVEALLVMLEGSESLPLRQAMRVAIVTKLKAGETL